MIEPEKTITILQAVVTPYRVHKRYANKVLVDCVIIESNGESYQQWKENIAAEGERPPAKSRWLQITAESRSFRLKAWDLLIPYRGFKTP